MKSGKQTREQMLLSLNHPAPDTVTIQVAVNVTPEVLKDPEMLAHAAERAGQFWHEAAKRRAVQYGLLQE